jgi:hypothetical protein
LWHSEDNSLGSGSANSAQSSRVESALRAQTLISYLLCFLYEFIQHSHSHTHSELVDGDATQHVFSLPAKPYLPHSRTHSLTHSLARTHPLSLCHALLLLRLLVELQRVLEPYTHIHTHTHHVRTDIDSGVEWSSEAVAHTRHAAAHLTPTPGTRTGPPAGTAHTHTHTHTREEMRSEALNEC